MVHVLRLRVFESASVQQISSSAASASNMLLDGCVSEQSQQLKARAEAFAIAVVKFCDTLPNSIAGRRIGEQLLNAGTSVAANYRAVCRAYTTPLFIAKLAIVDEEADECELWFRIIRETGLQTSDSLSGLQQEAHELACIFGASLRTARANARRRREANRKSGIHRSVNP